MMNVLLRVCRYGFGYSEEFVNEFMTETGTKSNVVVATKFAPLPWRQTPGSLVGACRKSLQRLGLPKMGLYIQHWWVRREPSAVRVLGCPVRGSGRWFARCTWALLPLRPPLSPGPQPCRPRCRAPRPSLTAPCPAPAPLVPPSGPASS